MGILTVVLEAVKYSGVGGRAPKTFDLVKIYAKSLKICAKSLEQKSPTWCPRAPGPRKDHAGRPRTCSENDINMINVFTLTNINTIN